jgi:hypothetical protein
MNRDGDLPSAMHPLPRQTNNWPLSAADAERLLARAGAHPEAPAVQHALAGLLDSAAGPPSDRELADEAAAVAGFMLVNGRRDARGLPRFRTLAWRGRTVAAGIGVTVVVAFSGAAAANALPPPIQELVHRTFDAPAPRHAVPSPRPPVSPIEHGHSDPGIEPSPSRSAQSNHGKAKATEKRSPTSAVGSAHGKAKGRTVPSGHQKG